MTDEVKKEETPQIQIQTGNIDVLLVKLLSDLNINIKRIADTLEKK